MGVFSENAIIGASNASGYNIPYSMYMPDAADSSPKLSRTLTSAGAETPKWTFATWYKKGRPTTSAKTLMWFQCKSIDAAATWHLGFQNDTINYGGGLRLNLWNGAGASHTDWDTDNNAGSNYGMAFRDYTDWFHICHIVDYSTSPYVFLYMNGVLMDPTYVYGLKNGPGYGTNYAPLTGNIMRIASSDGGDPGNGYFADTYFIEGQNLPPVGNFLEVDALTNETRAIEYTGTYSGNSFYFDYADSADFGKDVSGLDNHFTAASIPAKNQFIDTPQNTVGSNFSTLNGAVNVYGSHTFSEGNRCLTRGGADTWGTAVGTFAPDSGKWYFEGLLASSSGTLNTAIGLAGDKAVEVWNGSTGNGRGDNGSMSYSQDGSVIMDGNYLSPNPYGATYGVGDIIGVAFDLDASPKTCTFYKNNTVVNATFNLSSHFTNSINVASLLAVWGREKWTMNYGQDSSFNGDKTAQNNSDGGGKGDFYYTPPSGYLALCEDNLGDPTIKLPEEHFKWKGYTGDGNASQAITGVGFKPDFTFVRDRSQGNNNVLAPSVQPAKFFISNGTSAIQTGTDFVKSFESDGFTVGSNSAVNYNNDNFTSWNWLGDGAGGSANTDGSVTSTVSANPTAGFSVLKFTGTGSALTVGHGLSQAPEMIIGKCSAASTNWPWYTPTSSGPSNIMYFNLSNTLGTDAQSYTSISASTIGIGTTTDLNQNATETTLWCFHSIPGYSKLGTAKLMGSSPSGNDGTFIPLGFTPSIFMWKMSDTAHAGVIFTREATNGVTPAPHNVANIGNVPMYNYADQISVNPMIGWDFCSNGIKQRQQYSVNTIMYYAVAAWPFKYARAQ